MYETASGTDIASTEFIQSSSALPLTGITYHAVPVDIWPVASYTISIKVTFSGGGVYRYAPCTLNLVCGLTSQTLTFSPQTLEFGSSFPDPAYIVLNAGVSDMFTINFSKFIESNSISCFILSYFLLDPLAAPYTAIVPPTITASGYTITLPTDLLVNRTFSIHSLADGGVIGDSPLLDIRIVCGSETLTSLNVTPSELVVSKDALNLFPVLPNWAGYWQTNKAQCDLTHYNLLSPSLIVATGEIFMLNNLDPSTAQISVNGLTPQRTMYFL